MNNVIPLNRFRTILQYKHGELKSITKKFIPLIHRSPVQEGKVGGAAQSNLRRAPIVSREIVENNKKGGAQ